MAVGTAGAKAPRWDPAWDVHGSASGAKRLLLRKALGRLVGA